MSTNDAAAPHRTEALLARLLTAGIALSAVVMLIGLALTLAQGGGEPVGSHAGERPTFSALLTEVASGDGRAITLLGLALLVCTPVARVVATMVLFARQRAWTYVLAAGLVLALLVVGVLVGGA